MVARLQQKALLRVHAFRFRWLDGEERSIEASGVVCKEVTASVLYSTRSVTMLFVETIDIPTILGYLGHSRSAFHK